MLHKLLPVVCLCVVLATLSAHTLAAPDSAPEPAPAARAPAEHVVLLHGLGRTERAMGVLAGRLEAHGFVTHRFEYPTLRAGPEDILEIIARQFDACCRDAARVHFVGHSMGGLVVRAFVNRVMPENLGRVVLLGAPAGGSELVARWRDKVWFKAFAGATDLTLGVSPGSLPCLGGLVRYPLGVIAGTGTRPGTSELLPGPDDGLVSVASTRIPGMADFIVVESSHYYLRYDRNVAEETALFLKSGRFSQQAVREVAEASVPEQPQLASCEREAGQDAAAG